MVYHSNAAPLIGRDSFIFEAEGVVTLLLQPVSRRQTLIHGLLPYEVKDDRLKALRNHNTQLTKVRNTIETIAREWS
jgi:hypothetical protein